MIKRLLALVAIGGLGAATANAAVILPNTDSVRFEGIAAFGTAFQPFINVETGELLTSAPAGSPPLSVTGFGEINTILDANNSNNKGTINGELTFTYTGATLQPFGTPSVATTPTSVTYSITSNVVGGTLNMYDDASPDLNTAQFIGQNISVPGSAQDGTPYLTANTPEGTVANIVISYFRPTPTSNFTNFTILLQTLNGGQFTINGGSILDDNPNLAGRYVQVSQDGLFSRVFQTGTIDGVTVNLPVNALVEGDVVIATNVIPEPASLALAAVGLILTTGFFGRRRQLRA